MGKSEKSDDKDDKPLVARTAVGLQKLKLEKLMKNPDKPIVIPDRQKDKKLPHVPDFVRNVMGSSAGAGSGEFHVYRHLRRKEYARQKIIHERSEKEQLDFEYQMKLEENKKAAEERTAKKRAKRLKRKEKLKKKKVSGDSKEKGGRPEEGGDMETSEDSSKSDEENMEICPEEKHDEDSKLPAIEESQDSSSTGDVGREEHRQTVESRNDDIVASVQH